MLLASEDIKQKQNERKEINPKIDADYLKKKKKKKKKKRILTPYSMPMVTWVRH